MKLTTLLAAGALLLAAQVIVDTGAGRAGAAVVRKVDGTSVSGALVSLADGVLTVADEADASKRQTVRLEDVLDVTGLSSGGGGATGAAAATAPAGGAATAPARPARPTMRIVKPAAKTAAGGTSSDPGGVATAQPAAPQGASGAATQPTAATQPAASTQPAAPTSYQVELAGGGRLRGKIEAWSDQQLRLAPALLDGTVVSIPLPHVRAVWAGAANRVAEAQAMRVAAAAADPAAGAADVAYVLREDKVHAVPGVALGIDDDALRFRYEGQDRRIALGRLVGVALAAQDAPPEAAAFHQSMQFAGGDESLPGAWTSLADDGKTLGVRTLWGEPLSVPAAKVTTVAIRNGRLVYLSDLAPGGVEQVPYFDRVIPFRTDVSLTGTPLRLSDGPTTRGVAVHARCVLHYDLGGTFDTFRSRVGFQQPEGKRGRADVRVLGDGKVMFEKLDARGDQPPTDVEVRVAGVKRLTLEVDFGPEEDVGDRVVWGDAKLMRPTVATVQAAPR
jgi:hypothetical protein